MLRVLCILFLTLWALPCLAAELQAYRGSGTVIDIEPEPGGARLTLTEHDFPFAARVRVTARLEALPRLYDRLELTAGLSRPPLPAAPGAFDTRQYLHDQGIAAIGFAYGAAVIVAEDTLSLLEASNRRLMHTRLHLTDFFIKAAADPASGALAAAFVTGQRGYIPDAVNDAYRISGLYHYLSISGTHMTLVIGVVFLLLRLCLLFTAAPHKGAALGAILAATASVALAGFEIPAVRAWLMGVFVMLAILSDRRVLSLWTLGFAALAITVVVPVAVWSPSFQLSFLAVLTLLLTARELARWEWLRRGGELRRTVKITLLGFLATTVSISIATAPMTAFYFQQISLYAVVANAAAAPLSGFVIMPSLALASVVQAEWAAQPAFWGLSLMTRLAEGIAGWPAASLSVPVFPWWLVGVLLLLIALLFYGRFWWLRSAAFGAIAGCVWLISSQPMPDVLLSSDGRSVVLVSGQKLTALSFAKNPRGRRDWQRLYAAEATAVLRPGDKTAPGCDAAACLVYLVTPEGVLRVALAAQPASLADVCARADIVLASVPPPLDCGRLFAVSGRYLERTGAMALWYRFGRVEKLSGAASPPLQLP